MNRILEMAKSSIPNTSCILMVSRGDGRVMLLGTPNPHFRLHALHAASPLEHYVQAWMTGHYAAIVRDLQRRFHRHSEDGLGIWFDVEAEALSAAIGEYDMRTGARTRHGHLEVGSQAWVKDLGPGRIEGFSVDRALIRLTRPRGGMDRIFAPLSLVKPHLRCEAA